jgi:5,10-methylenetetrahydromethanopterin reductase
VAEELGYERLWVYDSPALHGDVWLALGRAAEVTTRLGLASGVAVPSLRHVMVTASAIAAVEELAPGRLVAAFGTGFTARQAMGRTPMRWADLVDYVAQLRGLLRGEVVEVEGAPCQMIHSSGFGPSRPIEVPLLLAPVGPKGFAAARQVADGVVLVAEPSIPLEERWDICAQLVTGLVLDAGEDAASDRVRSALGPAFVTGYHAIWQWEREAVDRMPGGREWRAALEGERPEGERHLAVHEGHLVQVTGRDRPLLDAAGDAVLQVGWTGEAATFQDRLRRARAGGVTEAVVTPAGPDIPHELLMFACASGSGVASSNCQ